jgi:hypothetical protein
MLSPFVKNGCLLFTIRDCERTIEPRIHTSPFDGVNENSSGSNQRALPNGSCRSTLPSTTPSTSNAIFYPDASSKNYEPGRSPSGVKAGLPPDADHDRILATGAANVSMPSDGAGQSRKDLLPCNA